MLSFILILLKLFFYRYIILYVNPNCPNTAPLSNSNAIFYLEKRREYSMVFSKSYQTQSSLLNYSGFTSDDLVCIYNDTFAEKPLNYIYILFVHGVCIFAAEYVSQLVLVTEMLRIQELHTAYRRFSILHADLMQHFTYNDNVIRSLEAQIAALNERN